MPNDKELRFPATGGVAAVQVRATFSLELVLSFQPDATEQQIRQFILDRVAIATSLGACVKVPRVEIHPIGVVTPS